MTTVHISLGRDDGTDQTAAKGVVGWEPTTRREDGTMVILERGFTVPLVAGEATVTVDPSGLTWCWRVTERTDSGGTVRYVSVPDSATTVEYVDLPDVDPGTLLPWTPADPEAAYQSALDNLDVAAAVAAYLLANPVSAPVSSVNGKVGAVVLDADDVGADPAGTAAGLVGALVIELHTHANKTALDRVSGTNTGDQDLSGYATIAQPRNAQTGTAYTLVASDAGKIVTLDNASAITVTVPASTITVPTDTVVRVDFLVLGTGMPTFVGSGGMTINADPSLVADAQYAGLSLLLLSATSGVLVGRLATP